MRAVVGHDPDFNPRRTDQHDKQGKFKKHSNNKIDAPKNITTVQFLIWAHGISYATFKRWKVEDFKWTKYVPEHAGKSVLLDSAFAKTIYTPQRMFLNVKMAEWYEAQRTHSHRVDADAKRQHRSVLKKEWVALTKDMKCRMRSLLGTITQDSHS
jgi:hypothetical protein